MIVFFFLQAEDGIRDGTVTGVQTCALPIAGPLLHPLPVVPLIVEAMDDGGRLWGGLGPEGERVSLIHPVFPVPRSYVVFVEGPLGKPRDEPLPDAGPVVPDPQAVGIRVPAVKVPYYGDLLGVRGPHGEVHAPYTVMIGQL